MVLNAILAVVVGYLLGSIPFAYIAARLKGRVDIRKIGGGNVGALNTIREIGVALGFAVLIADVAKGVAAVLFAQWLGVSLMWVFIAGLAAIAGHNWSLFLRFTGGMGTATAMGVLLVLVPIEFAISFAILALVIIITSNVRLGIIIGLAFLPLIAWQFGESGMVIGFCVVIPLFCCIKLLVGLRRRGAVSVSRGKGLIFDREYHFWQARKK